jgi:hypothetical protein
MQKQKLSSAALVTDTAAMYVKLTHRFVVSCTGSEGEPLYVSWMAVTSVFL